MCPLERTALSYLLQDPNKPGSACTATVHVTIEPAGGGAARVGWDAQELESGPAGGCQTIGPEYEGVATIDGACCSKVIDISLPEARRTFRLVVRTDWAQ
jgi:hypothetical protein